MLYKEMSRFLNLSSGALSLLLFFSVLTQGEASFYNRKAEGWHWYEPQPLKTEQQKKEEDSKEKKVPNPEAPKMPEGPLEQLEAFKQEIRYLKAKAMIEPTFENLKAYMEIQKEVMDRASAFSNQWLQVLYRTPHLDRTLEWPVSQVGRHAYLDEQRKTLERRIKDLSKTHGLFFFYSTGCAYCKHFAPIVKSFASKYGWNVIAISMDGGLLPEFPKATPNNGTAEALGIQSLPTLMAVDPTREEIVPLSYGLSTHDQLEERIRVLILERNPS